MKTHAATVVALSATLFAWACSGVQIAGQVQAGRRALQEGRSQEAIALLQPAAQTHPAYRNPQQVGVLTYLGRAYYETGRTAEAQAILEQALARTPDDPPARLYLGLVRFRAQSTGGREAVDAGLQDLHGLLDMLAANSTSGPYWDPAGTLRSQIRTALASGAADPAWVAAVERIGRDFDQEIDEATRDEGLSLSRGSGGGD